MAEAKIKITTETGDSGSQLQALIDRIEKLENANKEADSSLKSMSKALAEAQAELAKTTEEQKKLEAEQRKTAEAQAKAEKQAQAYKDALQNLANGMGGAIGQSVAFIASLKDSYKEGGAATAALVGLTGVLNGLNSVFNKVTEAVKGNAEEGDKAALALVGSYEHVNDSVGNLFASLAEGLAPAMAGIAQIVAPLIDNFREWVQEQNKSGAAAGFMAEAFLVLIGTLRTVVTITNEVRTTYAELQWQLGSITDKEYSDFLKSIKATEQGFIELENSILTLKNNMANGGIGVGKAMEEEGKWADKGFRLIADLENQLVEATGKSHAERIEIIKKFRDQEAEMLGERPKLLDRVNDMIRAEERAAASERIEDAKQAHEERLKNEEEQRKEINELVTALEQEGYAMQEALAQEQKAKMAEELAAEEEERIAANERKWTEAVELAQMTIATQEELRDRLHEINLEILASDTATAEQKKAASMDVANRIREDNEKLRSEAEKTAQVQAQKAEEARKKVSDSVLNMAKVMLNTQMSMKEKAAAIFDEMTKLITDALLKQLSMLVSTSAQGSAAKSAAAATNIATSKAEAVAEASTVPPKVASSFAGLGPLGMGLAAIALSFFMGMIKTKVGLEEGGSVSGKVPGMGRSDMVDASLNSREGVVNERGMAALGSDNLDYLNSTGRLPFAQQASNQAAAGPININLNVTVSGGVPPSPREFWKPIIPGLTEALDDYVLRRGGTLTATGMRLGRTV